MTTLCTDYKRLIDNSIEGLVSYLRKNRSIQGLIIGLSGGIDSALVTFIAKVAIEKIQSYPIILAGYSIPIGNDKDENKRADAVGQLCEIYTVNTTLQDDFMKVVHAIDPLLYSKIMGCALSYETLDIKSKIMIGNMKARLRMMYLYHEAKKYNGLVLSTDNLTEYMLGFWTLHGDVGDFAPIQQLFKSEVYGMAEWIDQQNYQGSQAIALCRDAKPTDGLGISDSDLDQILPGWEGSYIDGYRKVDDLLIHKLRGGWLPDSSVLKMHNATQFKRDNPAFIKRLELLKLSPIDKHHDYIY